MNHSRALIAAALLIAGNVLAPLSAARAELVLSQLILDLEPARNTRGDVEIWNNGRDVVYVAVEPREILRPGTPLETGLVNPDPEQLGLLVSPARMILDPGQRKRLRIASISKPAYKERVYRVTVKPVVGQLSSDHAGLKILVGYDLLVLVRPTSTRPSVVGIRAGDHLIVRNDGNISVELMDGKACDAAKKVCEPLAGGRIYAGAEKKFPISSLRRAHYVIRIPGKMIPQEF
jgi:P pilus assembly chaperone PapD